MPIRVLPARGLADLHTLAGRADRQIPSYKAYLRVSFLELERTRHEQEIATTRRRLDFMVARCAAIDGEKSQILAAAEPAMPRQQSVRPRRGNVAAVPPPKPGFRFAY
jgi:hypothetical protein